MKAEKQAPVTGETTSDKLKTLCSSEKLKLFKNRSNAPLMPWSYFDSLSTTWLTQSGVPPALPLQVQQENRKRGHPTSHFQIVFVPFPGLSIVQKYFKLTYFRCQL